MTKVQIMSNCCADIYANTPDTYGYQYRVQIGIYKLYNKALDQQMRLLEDGYLADIDRQGELFTLNIGDFTNLDEAVLLERFFRFHGYNTLVIAI